MHALREGGLAAGKAAQIRVIRSPSICPFPGAPVQDGPWDDRI